MTDISVPSSLDGVEPVQSVRTPIRLEYTFTPGVAAQTYLREFANKKILGVVSPSMAQSLSLQEAPIPDMVRFVTSLLKCRTQATSDHSV